MKKLRVFAAALAVLLLCGCANTATVPEETTEPVQALTGPIILGSKMPELSVTTAQGETLQLSELLQQKKAVVLNFWFADCIWCVREFPVMEAAYQNYREDLEILALNPYDSADTIAAFQQEHSLSFPMGSCSQELAYALGVNGYPTSVVIDREGTVSLIHSGAITESGIFDQLFSAYTGEDYTPRVYNSIGEFFS